MRGSQRNFVSIALIFILILIVFNLFSYTPPTDDSASNDINSAVMITESTHDFKQFKKEIEELTSLHRAQENEINSLKDIITDLQQQIKENSKTHLNAEDPNVQLQTVQIIAQNTQKPKSSKTPRSSDGPAFKLIPENEIIFPLITISNKQISDTPSSPNSKIIKDTNGHSVIYEADSGVIHGNPLLIEECANALTMDHEINILSSISYFHNSFVPWFWSRESIGSVLKNQQFNAMSSVLTRQNFDNLTNAVYVILDNSAAEIMTNTMLKSTDMLQTIRSQTNHRIRSKCGFTFVQHPITRFIAAYFKVNVLIWNEMKTMEIAPDLFYDLSFYKITGDLRKRLKAFMNDLRKYHIEFVEVFPFMTELRTQSGQLSFNQIDIAHVFKYEYMRSEYLNILSDSNDEFCIDEESDHFVFDKDGITDEKWDDLLFNFGVNREDLKDIKFREWMGLKTKLSETTSFDKIEEFEKMDILYVYDAMDYEMYSKVVEYYWQDFVCFDYAADYKKDVLDYLTDYQDQYEGFPVKNRTRTNWDTILDFYYSKHNRQQRH